MLYRRNCNTLLSSSLQRCYINGVCFAFQLAALWKRRSVFLSLGTSTHPRGIKKKKRKKRIRSWNSVGWSELHRTQTFDLRQKEKPTSGRDGRPSHLSRYLWYVLLLFHVKQQSCSPFSSSAREPISCRQSIKPNQSAAVWLTGQLMK